MPGFKTFSDGDVLTAADVNDYLMEQVVVQCTSGTRPSSPNEGQMIYETDTDLHRVYTGSSWQLQGWANGDRYARKLSTESVTSSTSLQTDDEVFLGMAATGVYQVTVLVKYDAATAGDIKIGFSGPASASFDYVAAALGTSAGLYVDDQTFIGEITSTPIFGGLGTGTNAGILIQGLLAGGGTAGNFNLQWAQGTSSGTATRVFAGSFMTLRRLA